MKRVNRNPYDEPEKLSNLVSRNNFSRDPDKKLSVVLREPPSDSVSEASTSVFQAKQSEGLSQDLSYSVELSKDELMGGLLGARIDGRSCVSRYMAA
ncbi:hypothetical protein K1719_002312 [Acacia pycnantha]|nr:hypothetical protein K1719_002312 [Acacia pycnantha]